MTTNDFDFLYKIVLIGDSGVGKSNICLRYMKNDFREDSKTTIGVEFTAKMIKTEDNLIIKAQIWDTAGEEKYASVTNAYFRGAVGALLIYDITARESFDKIPMWLKKLQESANDDLVIMLVGNKTDLDHLRKVSFDEG